MPLNAERPSFLLLASLCPLTVRATRAALVGLTQRSSHDRHLPSSATAPITVLARLARVDPATALAVLAGAAPEHYPLFDELVAGNSRPSGRWRLRSASTGAPRRRSASARWQGWALGGGRMGDRRPGAAAAGAAGGRVFPRAGSVTTMMAATSTAVPSSISRSDSATVAERGHQATGSYAIEIRVPLVQHSVIRPLQRQRQLIG